MASHPQDLLTCVVCLETFQDPHLLGDCGHTFCKRCIAQVQASVLGGGLGGLKCPTCRRPFRPNQVLPNFALRALLDERVLSPAPQAFAPSSGPYAVSANGGDWNRPRFARGNRIIRNVDASAGGATLERLMELGFPAELGKLVLTESKQVAQRIFLLDNSGSTHAPDGQILLDDPSTGERRWKKVTRWEEICEMAAQHAMWNIELGTPAEFVLLNARATGDGLEEGLDYCVVDAAKGDGERQVEAVRQMLRNNGPRGVTPIADRLRKIHAQLLPQARDLARSGQQVVLVIVTDGMPTGPHSSFSSHADQQEVVRELRRISTDLPVHIVVRLCTSDNEVANFYNGIDAEVELQLEIVDDMKSEALECRKAGNRFLVYSPLIHLLREGGTFMKILDLMDERRLDPMEASLLCQLILRQDKDDQPMPSNPYEYCDAAHCLLQQCPQVFDPIWQKMVPPINLAEMEWAIEPKSDFERRCGDMCGCALAPPFCGGVSVAWGESEEDDHGNDETPNNVTTQEAPAAIQCGSVCECAVM